MLLCKLPSAYFPWTTFLQNANFLMGMVVQGWLCEPPTLSYCIVVHIVTETLLALLVDVEGNLINVYKPVIS